MPPANSLAAFLLRKQGAVFGWSVFAGGAITFATGRPAHEVLLANGARRDALTCEHAHAMRTRAKAGCTFLCSRLPSNVSHPHPFPAPVLDAFLRSETLADAANNAGETSWSVRLGRVGQ